MSKKLLVVDDAMIIREKIKDAAISDGWEIVGEAANGQEAIEQYNELMPDVVTIDIVMPEFDGLHGLKGIIKTNPDARVLMVSALDQVDILKEAIAAGASDFVVKPFEDEKLLQAINAVGRVGQTVV